MSDERSDYSHIPKNLKKHASRKFGGVFNDFLDLFDTPTKYTKPKDMLIINEDSNGLEFIDPVSFLSDLFEQVQNIKGFKQNFSETNHLIVQHNLNSFAIEYKIYTNNGESVLPGEARIIDRNTIEFEFNPPLAGQVVIITV
jgi:hypothetical protein